MGTDKVAASGSKPLTQDELKALLDIATAAKREQAGMAATSIPATLENFEPLHWGNTDAGRIAGAGVFLMCICVGLFLLCGGVALILAALR
jgi:hypothetical protein